jgi:hypothetical protein
LSAKVSYTYDGCISLVESYDCTRITVTYFSTRIVSMGCGSSRVSVIPCNDDTNAQITHAKISIGPTVVVLTEAQYVLEAPTNVQVINPKDIHEMKVSNDNFSPLVYDADSHQNSPVTEEQLMESLKKKRSKKNLIDKENNDVIMAKPENRRRLQLKPSSPDELPVSSISDISKHIVLDHPASITLSSARPHTVTKPEITTLGAVASPLSTNSQTVANEEHRSFGVVRTLPTPLAGSKEHHSFGVVRTLPKPLAGETIAYEDFAHNSKYSPCDRVIEISLDFSSEDKSSNGGKLSIHIFTEKHTNISIVNIAWICFKHAINQFNAIFFVICSKIWSFKQAARERN